MTMPFHRAPLAFILSIPIMCLAGAGAIFIAGGIGYGLWWIISHLAWVP